MDSISVFDELYERLLELPPAELKEILRNVLPPEELFQRTDGTLFIIRVHGLRIFDTSAMLEEAGIPHEDPRSRVFRELRGGLIDRDVPNGLRAIAAREETVCKNAGAVRIWIGSRKGWWVPVGATSKFKAALDALFQEYETLRDSHLVERYAALYGQARERFEAAAQSAWEDMHRLGRVAVGKRQYVESSLETFEARFPSKEAILEKVKMVLEARQQPLPPRLGELLSELRHKERQILEAQLERERAAAKKTFAEAEQQAEQLRIERLEREMKQQQLYKLEEERKLRDDLIREAISAEYEQAQQIVLQIQSRLVVLAHEITDAVSQGRKIAPATKNSWRKTLEQLSVLAPENPAIEAALASLEKVSEKKTAVSQSELQQAKRAVSQALASIENRAKTQINADDLWKLIAQGEGEAVLRRLNQIRAETADNLSELDALYELALQIGASSGDDQQGATP